jgi:hypothetical protein
MYCLPDESAWSLPSQRQLTPLLLPPLPFAIETALADLLRYGLGSNGTSCATVLLDLLLCLLDVLTVTPTESALTNSLPSAHLWVYLWVHIPPHPTL